MLSNPLRLCGLAQDGGAQLKETPILGQFAWFEEPSRSAVVTPSAHSPLWHPAKHLMPVGKEVCAAGFALDQRRDAATPTNGVRRLAAAVAHFGDDHRVSFAGQPARGLVNEQRVGELGA